MDMFPSSGAASTGKGSSGATATGGASASGAVFRIEPGSRRRLHGASDAGDKHVRLVRVSQLDSVGNMDMFPSSGAASTGKGSSGATATGGASALPLVQGPSGAVFRIEPGSRRRLHGASDAGDKHVRLVRHGHVPQLRSRQHGQGFLRRHSYRGGVSAAGDCRLRVFIPSERLFRDRPVQYFG
jgi:urease beta subunit